MESALGALEGFGAGHDVNGLFKVLEKDLKWTFQSLRFWEPGEQTENRGIQEEGTWSWDTSIPLLFFLTLV